MLTINLYEKKECVNWIIHPLLEKARYKFNIFKAIQYAYFLILKFVRRTTHVLHSVQRVSKSSQIFIEIENREYKIHGFLFLETGSYLSSRAVTSQVLSAYKSLTSVFGMGTGGTSSQSTPTIGFRNTP